MNGHHHFGLWYCFTVVHRHSFGHQKFSVILRATTTKNCRKKVSQSWTRTTDRRFYQRHPYNCRCMTVCEFCGHSHHWSNWLSLKWLWSLWKSTNNHQTKYCVCHWTFYEYQNRDRTSVNESGTHFSIKSKQQQRTEELICRYWNLFFLWRKTLIRISERVYFGVCLLFEAKNVEPKHWFYQKKKKNPNEYVCLKRRRNKTKNKQNLGIERAKKWQLNPRFIIF